MAFDRGPNGGISGTLIDISGGPTFNVLVAAWEVAQGVQSMPVPGRGDATAWVPTISFGPGGTVVVSGTAQLKQPPTPADFQGRSGTITETFHSAAKYVTPVRINRVDISLAKEPQDGWRITLTGTVTGYPTISGFGAAAPAAVGPDAIEKELFSGLTKTSDPRNLIDAAARLFIVRPLANTDAAENGKLADLIAGAIEPFPGAKVKYARLEPNRMYDAAFFTVSFAHTDTEEDVVNPQTFTTLDPDGIGNNATIAEVNTTPDVPAGFSDQGVTEREIHDTAELRIRQAGVRTRKQGIEQDGTTSNEDQYSILDDGKAMFVTGTSTPPTAPTISGQELLAVVSQQFQTTPERWTHTFLFGNTNSRDRILFPDSPIEDDPSELTDKDQKAEFNTSSTPPATPTPRIADLQLRRRVSVRVTGTPAQWKHTFYFARNTEKDDVEIQGAFTGADPNDLGETAVIRRVTTSETPPSTPAAPVGQLVDTITEPLTVANGSYTGQWVHTFKYGSTTKLQGIEFEGDLIVDPANIQDADVQTVVNGSSTPPATPSPRTADLKLRRRRSHRMQGTPEKWTHVFEFARNTSEDELEHKKRTVDPDDFEETERIPIIHTSETSSPGTPSQLGTASNLIGTEVERLCVPSGAFTGLWVWTFIFGPSTRKQTIEQEGDVAADPDLLDDDDAQTLTNGSSTPPATPAARITGQVLVRRISRKIQDTPAKWRHRFEYGYRTSADKLEADGTTTTTDPDGLESSAVTVAVYLAASPPSDPSPPAAPAGLKLDNKFDRNTNNPLYKLRIYRWALTTSAERIVNQHTFTEEDPEGLTNRQQKAAINTTPTLDGVFVERTTRSQELNDGNVLNIVDGGVRNTRQDVEFLKSESTAEAGGIKQKEVVVRVTGSSTPDPTGLNPDATNLSLYWSQSHRETATGLHVHAYEFAPLTPTEEMTAQFERDDVDPAALEDEHTRVLYGATSTPTAAPTVAGQVRHKTIVKRVGKAKYRYVYEYRYRTSADQLVADKTRTTTDPNGLESEAVTAAVWLVSGGAPADPSAPATPTGLKLVDKTDLEIQNPLYRVRVYRWALTDSKDKIELPGSQVEYDQLKNLSRRVTTVEADATAILTIGEALRTTHKADVTVARFGVERLNAATVKKWVDYISQFENVTTKTFGGYDYFPTRYAPPWPSLGGVIQVHVSQVVERGDGLRAVYIGQQYVWYAEILITIRKRLSSSGLPTHFNLVGTSNAEEFLGLPAGFVGFLGSNLESERLIDVPKIVEAEYVFKFDTRGLYGTDGVVMDNWVLTDASVSVGWNNISAFGWSGGSFPAGDYNVFLT